MIVVLVKDALELNEFVMAYCLEHVLTVSGVVEKAATFACRALLFETCYVSHDHRSYEVFRTNAFEVIIALNTVKHPYLMKNSR